MEKIDYKKQLYLFDDRNQYDYLLKITNILFENDEVIVCKTVMIGSAEYHNQIEEETITINKKDGTVANQNYSSWLVTSDENWIQEKIEDILSH